eukprot:768851_1
MNRYRMSTSLILVFVMVTFNYNANSLRLHCDEAVCDFGICDHGNHCTNNEYVCTDKASTCKLECDSHCEDISVISSAEDTTMVCSHPYSCNNVSVLIEKPNERLYLECKESSACFNINIKYQNVNGTQTVYTYPFDTDETSQIKILGHETTPQNKRKSTMTIIKVSLFWLMTCIGILLAIKLYRTVDRMNRTTQEKKKKYEYNECEQSRDIGTVITSFATDVSLYVDNALDDTWDEESPSITLPAMESTILR